MTIQCSCTRHNTCKKDKKKEKLFKLDVLNSFSPSYGVKTYCQEIIDLYEIAGYKFEICKEINATTKEESNDAS